MLYNDCFIVFYLVVSSANCVSVSLLIIIVSLTFSIVVPPAIILLMTPSQYLSPGVRVGFSLAACLGAVFFALVAAFPPRHPVDYLYNYGVRQLLGKPKMPPRPAQGRFACAIATAWLGSIMYCFSQGFDMAAYILGGTLLVVAGLVSSVDLCIPSLIYNALFAKNKSSVESSQANGP